MGKFSIAAKAQEVKTGFESYDGPEPRSGMHRAVVKQLRFIRFGTGSHGFKVLVELEAAKGDPRGHKQFDGWPGWSNVVAVPADGEPMKEGSQRGLSNFLAALGVGDDPDVVTEDGDVTKGVKIKKLGKKLVTGIEGKAVVTVDLGSDEYKGETRMVVNNIFKAKEDGVKFKDEAAEAEAEEEEVDEEAEDAEEETDDDAAVAEREEELTALTVVKLRAEAKSAGLTAADIKGLGKEELISAILDEEFGVAEEGEDVETEEEDEEADSDVEAEDEEEEEEEEADEEEEEEEEDDSERRAELEAMARPALVKLAKGLSIKVLKSHADSDIVDNILAAEAGGDQEVPF